MSLLRNQADTVDLSALEGIAQRMARGVQELLSSRLGTMIAVAAGAANLTRYPDWRIAQNPHGALLRYQLPGRTGQMLIHVPGYLITQLVDISYGGNGAIPARSEFSAAETHFTQWLGDQFALLLQGAFKLDDTVRFAGIETDLLQTGWPKAHDAIVVQSLAAESSALKSAIFALIIPAECARQIADRQGGTNDDAAPVDSEWSERMRTAAMRVTLPARTVLTRSEVPFHKMLTLAPGDILPLLLPTQIPLIVAGRVFAHGSLGEANGRAALLIEKMQKEIDQ
jgi:flagellar motor switch protein FliM